LGNSPTLIGFLVAILLTSVLAYSTSPVFGVSCTQEEYDELLSMCLSEVSKLCQTAEVCEIVRNACYDAARQACDSIVPSDSDGDGVPDSSDACPNEYGTVNGCPAPVDSDGDGVPDSSDACPNEYGTVNGCPAPVDSDGNGVLHDPVLNNGDFIWGDPPVIQDWGLSIPPPPGWTNVVPDDSYNENANCGVVYSGGVDSYNCKTLSNGYAKFNYASGAYLIGPASKVALYPPAPFIGMSGNSVQGLYVNEGTLQLEFDSSNKINCSQCKPIGGVGITFGQYSVGLEGTEIFLDVDSTRNGVLTVLEGSAEIWKTSDPDNKVLVSSRQQIDAITNKPLGKPTQASSKFLSSIPSIDEVPKNPTGPCGVNEVLENGKCVPTPVDLVYLIIIGVAAAAAVVGAFVFLKKKKSGIPKQKTPKFCNKCGTPVAPSNKFCKKCGNVIIKTV